MYLFASLILRSLSLLVSKTARSASLVGIGGGTVMFKVLRARQGLPLFGRPGFRFGFAFTGGRGLEA